jgi:hypothetical protein
MRAKSTTTSGGGGGDEARDRQAPVRRQTAHRHHGHPGDLSGLDEGEGTDVEDVQGTRGYGHLTQAQHGRLHLLESATVEGR